MPVVTRLDKVAINTRSHKLLRRLLEENPTLQQILHNARNDTEALVGVKHWAMAILEASPSALRYYRGESERRATFEALRWRDYAAIRILDYIDHAGKEYEDLNLHGTRVVNNPIKTIWLAVAHGTGGAKPAFFEDMLHLFRQLEGKEDRALPSPEDVDTWMNRYPSGLDPRIVRLHEENRDRILNVIIRGLDSGELTSRRFVFEPGMSYEQKFLRMLDWWNDHRFHLHFAARSPKALNEMLGDSLDPDTMRRLRAAQEAGIPFFVNPYYLSLLHVRVPYFAIGADLAIRDYVLYSRELVEEFGHIVAWEKEDIVKPGEPNAAGWILPSDHSVHRRYPEVAILIPETMGRACGGLCASCQRMYDFQRGNLNFDLDHLRPQESSWKRLERMLAYFRNDSQLRDILITGGDALMSTNANLALILNAVYEMALAKKTDNETRPEGEKYAEVVRVRLGTRLPVYLPQRINPELIEILRAFKERATSIGIQQFVVQTHFESPMEITPEAKLAVEGLLSAGWTVINQHVFTASASRRGHTARLRQALNDIGVLNYYAFSVKGYRENYSSFATNARAVQEQLEEKTAGVVPADHHEAIRSLPSNPPSIPARLRELRQKLGLPFLATDRNVLNLPGVGKSLTFRVIGITRYGRRILEFEHDATRRHSPIIHKMGKVVVIESKSISEYLAQLQAMGEDPSEYESLWGYSIGETEPRMSIYEYPDYDYEVTSEMTNLQIA